MQENLHTVRIMAIFQRVDHVQFTTGFLTTSPKSGKPYKRSERAQTLEHL